MLVSLENVSNQHPFVRRFIAWALDVRAQPNPSKHSEFIWTEKLPGDTELTLCRQFIEQGPSYISEIGGDFSEELRTFLNVNLNNVVKNTEQITLPSQYTYLDVLKASLLLRAQDWKNYTQSTDGDFRSRQLELIDVKTDHLTSQISLTKNDDKTQEDKARKNFRNEWVYNERKKKDTPSDLDNLSDIANHDRNIDKYELANCVLRVSEKFASDIRTLWQDPKIQQAFSGQELPLSTVLKLIYETYLQYLSVYFSENSSLLFQSLIQNILFNNISTLPSSDNATDMNQVVGQYLDNVRYNLSLLIAPAFTEKENQDQQKMYGSLLNVRSAQKLDERKNILEGLGVVSDIDIDAIAPPKKYSIAEETFTASILQDPNVDTDTILQHFFASNMVFLKQIDRSQCDDDGAYRAVLGRLWDAFVQDERCPKEIKDKTKDIKKAIASGDLQFAAVLDAAFLIKFKQATTYIVIPDASKTQQDQAAKAEKLRKLAEAEAKLLSSVAILWIYPDVFNHISASSEQQIEFNNIGADNPVTHLRLAYNWMRKHPGLNDKISNYYSANKDTVRRQPDEQGRARTLQVFLPVALSQIQKMADMSRIFNKASLDLDQYIVSPRLIYFLENNVATRIKTCNDVVKEIDLLIREIAQMVLDDFKRLFPDECVFSNKIYEKGLDAPAFLKNTVISQLMPMQLATLIQQYAAKHTVESEIYSVILGRAQYLLGSTLPEKIGNQENFYTALQEGVNSLPKLTLDERCKLFAFPERRKDALISMALEGVNSENITGILGLHGKISSELFMSKAKPLFDAAIHANDNVRLAELIADLPSRPRQTDWEVYPEDARLYLKDEESSSFIAINQYLLDEVAKLKTSTGIGKVSGQQSMRTILNSSLTLHEKLQLLGAIGRMKHERRGKYSDATRGILDKRSFGTQKFYKALAKFDGVEEKKIHIAFIDFLQIIDTSAENKSSEKFDVENLKKIAATPSAQSVKACFDFIKNFIEEKVNDLVDNELKDEGDKLESLLSQLRDTLSVFVQYILAQPDSLLNEVGPVIFKEIFELPEKIPLKALEKIMSGVKESLIEVLAVFVNKAAAENQTQKLSYIGVAGKELASESSNNGGEKKDKISFNEVVTDSEEEQSALSKASKYSYKQHLMMSLARVVDHKVRIEKYFSFSFYREYLSIQLQKSQISDPIKDAMKQILDSDFPLYIRLKFVGSLAEGVKKTEPQAQDFCEELTVFTTLTSSAPEQIFSIFAHFLKSQEKNYDEIEYTAQRYMLIQQNIVTIPVECFPENIREEVDKWCQDQVFTNRLTALDDMKKFQIFLDTNKSIIHKAIANNFLSGSWGFKDFFLAWVGFSLNNGSRPLEPDDLALIAKPPTIEEVLACREEILSIPVPAYEDEENEDEKSKKEKKTKAINKAKPRYLDSLYSCYIDNNYQSETFEVKLSRWLDLSIATQDVINISSEVLLKQDTVLSEEIARCKDVFVGKVTQLSKPQAQLLNNVLQECEAICRKKEELHNVNSPAQDPVLSPSRGIIQHADQHQSQVAVPFINQLSQKSLVELLNQLPNFNKKQDLLNIITSTSSMSEKFHSMAAIGKQILEDGSLVRTTKVVKKFCESLQILDGDADADTVIRFTAFLKAEGRLSQHVDNVEYYAQRYRLIHQQFKKVAEYFTEEFPYDDFRDSSLDSLEQIEKYRKFLKSNESIMHLMIKGYSASLEKEDQTTIFRGQLSQWIDLTTCFDHTLGVEDLSLISVLPTNDVGKVCWPDVKAKVKYDEAYDEEMRGRPDFNENSASALNIDSSKEDIRLSPSFAAITDYLRQHNKNASEALQWEAFKADETPADFSDASELQDSLPKLINELASDKNRIPKTALRGRIAELFSEDQLAQLKTALQEHHTYIQSSYFRARSIPRGMQEVVTMIDNREPVADILLKLKEVAQHRDSRKYLGASLGRYYRQDETTKAYERIEEFFKGDDNPIKDLIAVAQKPMSERLTDAIPAIENWPKLGNS